MYLDLNIQTISEWPLEHPKEVSDLLQAYNNVQRYGDKAPSWKYLEKPAKTVGVILEQARWAALTDNATLSRVLEQAHNTIGNSIIKAARDNFGFYLEQVEARFNQAAEPYAEAVAKLPESFEDKDALGFTPEQFEAYQSAKQAAGPLRFVLSFMKDASDVLRLGKLGEHRSIFLLVQPQDLEQYKAIQFGSRETSSAELAVFPELRNALAVGATLRLATPSEAAGDLARVTSGLAEDLGVE